MSKKEETVEAPKEEKEVLTDETKVGLERELRRYVKKGDPKKPDEPGGFRKGLSKEDEKKAQKIMKRLGRTELKWDLTILVPGFETYQT